MHRFKKSIVAAGLGAGLLGGSAAGLVLTGASVSGAQEAATTQSAAGTASSSSATSETTRPDPAEHFAEALAPLVADGTITQDQADAVTAALAEAMPADGAGGPGGPGMGHGGGPAGSEAAATALGISVDELRAAIEQGQTIAEVAAASGIDVQTVIDAMVAERAARLDESVAAGELTQEEADQKLADATTRITDEVNNGRPQRGAPPAEAPTDAPAESETTG
jgi:polyhydroxyalkanoate synthesis regulator phasin